MSDVIQLVRPDLHVALECPADWTFMDLDEQSGLRASDPSDPRVALQVTCDESDSALIEVSERVRNGLPEDALCESRTLQRGVVDAEGRASPGGPSVTALSFTARDGSFSFQVLVAEDNGHRWTIRLETLQRKAWWQESQELAAMLASLLLL